jgi:predicted amidohydrolase
MAAKHRKVHLPHQGFDKYATGGEGPLNIHKSLLGNIGLVVCYDLFFPETLRVLNLLGVELVAVPTNWAEGVEFYVDYLIQTRAIENHINIVAANRIGQEKQFTFYGRSCIVDYKGTILAEAGRDEELIMAEVDMDEPHRKHIIRISGEWETHKLRDRRPDLYKALTFR